jgi:hypothetical protein
MCEDMVGHTGMVEILQSIESCKWFQGWREAREKEDVVTITRAAGSDQRELDFFAMVRALLSAIYLLSSSTLQCKNSQVSSMSSFTLAISDRPQQ